MASSPPEWSDAFRRPVIEDDGDPAVHKLLRALEAQWLASESIGRYQRPMEQALVEAAATVTQITPPLRALVGGLPGEYTDQVRPATPYLFLCWMPIGYASILAVDAPEALPDAALAMMHYGAAITVLDDIADTDLYDGVWGEGVSDAIAEFVASHGLPSPAGVLPAVSREARWVLEYANERLRRFWALIGRLRGTPGLVEEFETVIGTFLESVRTCRRVRQRIAEGVATHSELQTMADAVPHGMTVVMVALLASAQRGVKSGEAIRQILNDADFAQRICHYQNALATLEREVADGDPSNPIVLDAMQKGRIDQRTFMERRNPIAHTLSRLEPSRVALEARLAAMEREFDDCASRQSRESDDAPYRHRFNFGVRNLHLLYKITRGQV